MSRSRSRLFPAVVTGVAIIVALVIAQSFSLLPKFSNPVKETEVDRTGPAILKSLDDLSEYHASTGEFQTLLDVEYDVKWMPGFIAGERMTYQAVGSVDGVVDLSAIDTRSVVITGTDEKVVTVVVPEPKLSRVTLDVDESKVISHDRGLANRLSDVFADHPERLESLQQKSVPKIAAAARESELKARAETNTRVMLTQLLSAAGADKVVVKFEDPKAPGGT